MTVTYVVYSPTPEPQKRRNFSTATASHAIAAAAAAESVPNVIIVISNSANFLLLETMSWATPAGILP